MSFLKRKILWAEDKNDHFDNSRVYLDKYLTERNIDCQIVRAINGDEIFRIIFENKDFDLLIVDIEMPRFNGLQAINALRKGSGAERIIIISSLLSTYHKVVESLVTARLILGAYDLDEKRTWAEAVFNALVYTPPRILHLSDIHFGGLHAFKAGIVIEKSIEPMVSQLVTEKSPNLIVLSGDITSSGVYDEYNRALDFIGWLAKKTKLPPERFIIVPGNHDIQRNVEDNRHFDRYIEFIRNIWKADEIKQRYPLLEHIKMTRNKSAMINQQESLFSLTVIHELRTIVVGFNSVVDKIPTIAGKRPDEIEKDPEWKRGEIAQSQLIETRNQLKVLSDSETGFLRMAVFHHHLFPIPSSIPKWEDRVISNQGLVVKELASMKFSVIMHGHIHNSTIYEYTPHYVHDLEKAGSLTVLSTGTLGYEKSRCFNFIFADFVLNSEEKIQNIDIYPYSLPTDTLKWNALPLVQCKINTL